MNELHLFAGAGGGILAGQLLGHRTVCAVEWEPYAQAVLVARQNDGSLPPFPIWDDVQTFDGRPWRGVVDVVAGGFPCQDISVAGKGAGITGERSGLWSHMARIVGEVRPRFVFVENSPALITRGLGVVLGDLAALGYDCKWTVLGAADVGAPHQRDRLWILAHSRKQRHDDAQQALRAGRDTVESGCEAVADADQHARHERGIGDTEQSAGRRDADRGAKCADDVADTDSGKRLGRWEPLPSSLQKSRNGSAYCWAVEPDVGRVADGVASRVDRLKAIGNGQSPNVQQPHGECLEGRE